MATGIKLTLILFLSSLILVLQPAHAQTTPCKDLSTEDCALLKNAQTLTNQLESGVFKLGIEFVLSAQYLGEIISFALVGDGVFMQLPFDVREDINLTYLPLLGFNADMSVLIDIELSEFLGMDDNTLTTAMELRYDKGIGYIDMSKVMPLIDPYIRNAGWYSLDIPLIMTRFIDNNPIPAPQEITDNSFANMSIWDQLGQIGTEQRLPDVVVNGKTLAVFKASSTIADFLENVPDGRAELYEEFRNQLNAQFPYLSSNDLEDTIHLFIDYVSVIEINLQQWVSLEDNMVQITQISMHSYPESVASSHGDPLGMKSMLSVMSWDLVIGFEFLAFENDKLVPAPENARPIRYEDLFGTGDWSSF